MKHCIVIITLLFISFTGFAQQIPGVRVTGNIPNAADDRLYQIQVGAYREFGNAVAAFETLRSSALNPSYDSYMDLTQVMIKGVNARDVPLFIQIIRNAGFPEVFVKIDPGNLAAAIVPVSTAALPSVALREIAYRSVKVGETKSLVDLVENTNVEFWTSSTPATVTVDSSGNITGRSIGNGYISINQTEYISVVVVPAEIFYLVSHSQEALLPEDSRTGSGHTDDFNEYRTEPTFRLAYRFNNKGENKGASGRNGGIDILGRGPDYEWLWTTYHQGGWFYDLNDVKREMIDGYQRDALNGVELTVKPEFVYDNGVPYLQLRHILHNTGNTPVTGQKFGASADVMISNNDYAPLLHTSYGAYMTDSELAPSLELMFICESGDGIDPVDTLWLGEYLFGNHLNYIYTDRRNDIRGVDSAIGFSYQNIDLAPGETKEFIVRFTLARTED